MNLLSSPKTHSWMNADEVNFRHKVTSLYSQLDKYIGKPTKLLGYVDEGISSVVALIEIAGKQYIAKSARWYQNVTREVTALRLWQQQGVQTPSIYQLLQIAEDEFQYISIAIYEYIDEVTAYKYYENNPDLDSLPTWENIGIQLARIHKVKTIGYGKPLVPDFVHGEFENLGGFINEKLLSLKAKSSLTEAGWLTKEVTTYLNDNIKLLDLNLTTSILGHNDLGLHNVLGHGSDITVFDPDPTLTHPYLDLATSHIWALVQSDQRSVDCLLAGYKSLAGKDEFDDKSYVVFFIIRLLAKQARWQERVNEDEYAKDALDKTSHLVQDLIK